MTDPRLEIAAQRLRNQRLTGATPAGVADVVGRLGAMQAQEYPLARWSIGQRAPGLVDADVERAFADGEILRTHVLRDTWHFVRAADIRWLVELTRPRIQARNATMYRRLGLDAELLARTDGLLVDALTEVGHVTRKQLGAFLRERGVEVDGMHLAYVLMHAELELLVCSGAPAGKQQTYALVEERAPRAPALVRDEALAELTRRYFTSHGPATLKDFTWWASLRVADARTGIDLLGGAELDRTDAGGRTYWSASSSPASSGTGPRAHLVQAYDECVIAYSESRDVLDVRGLARSVPGAQSTFMHAVLVGAQFAGHWRRRVTRRAMEIDVQLARALAPAERDALDDEVARYGRFVGLPASWSDAGR